MQRAERGEEPCAANGTRAKEGASATDGAITDQNIEMTLPDQSEAEKKTGACDPAMSRQEFIERVMKRAALVGGLLAAPKVVDRFLVPPAYAKTSTTCLSDTTQAADCTNGGLCSDTQAGAACKP